MSKILISVRDVFNPGEGAKLQVPNSETSVLEAGGGRGCVVSFAPFLCLCLAPLGEQFLVSPGSK